MFLYTPGQKGHLQIENVVQAREDGLSVRQQEGFPWLTEYAV